MNIYFNARRHSAMDSGAARFLAIIKAIESILFTIEIPAMVTALVNMFNTGMFSRLYDFGDYMSAAIVVSMALVLIYISVLEILQAIGLVIGVLKGAGGLRLTRSALSQLRVANIVLTILYEVLLIALKLITTGGLSTGQFFLLQIVVIIQILRICYISRLRDMADGAKYELTGEAPIFYPGRSLSVLAIILGSLNLLMVTASYSIQDLFARYYGRDFYYIINTVYQYIVLLTYFSAAKYITIAVANNTLGRHSEQKSLCLQNGLEYVPVYKSLLSVIGAVGFGYLCANSLSSAFSFLFYSDLSELAYILFALRSMVSAVGYALMCFACATYKRESLTISGAIVLSAGSIIELAANIVYYGDRFADLNVLSYLITLAPWMLWLIFVTICACIAKSRPLKLGLRIPLIILAALPFIVRIAAQVTVIVEEYNYSYFSYYIHTYIGAIISNLIALAACVMLSCILGKKQAQPNAVPSDIEYDIVEYTEQTN